MTRCHILHYLNPLEHHCSNLKLTNFHLLVSFPKYLNFGTFLEDLLVTFAILFHILVMWHEHILFYFYTDLLNNYYESFHICPHSIHVFTQQINTTIYTRSLCAPFTKIMLITLTTTTTTNRYYKFEWPPYIANDWSKKNLLRSRSSIFALSNVAADGANNSSLSSRVFFLIFSSATAFFTSSSGAPLAFKFRTRSPCKNTTGFV